MIKLAGALLCATLVFTGLSSAGERVRYDFPMFDGFNNQLAGPLGDGLARQIITANRVELGIADAAGEFLRTDLNDFLAVFAASDKLALATYEQSNTPLSIECWRIAFANFTRWNIEQKYQTDETRHTPEAKVRAEVSRSAYLIAAAKLCESFDPGNVVVDLQNNFNYNVISRMMSNGVVDVRFGAYALFNEPYNVLSNGSYSSNAMPNTKNFNALLTLDAKAAYKALATAMLSSPLENILWQPAPDQTDMSWIYIYANGYNNGDVSEADYRDTIAKLKLRAQAARGFYTIRKQLKYRELVDEWLVGVAAKPATGTEPAVEASGPLFDEFENL